MHLENFISIIGTHSIGLCELLAPHYKKIRKNQDEYIWENLGFMLAYFHLIGYINTAELQCATREISNTYPPNNAYREPAHNAILSSAEFYSNCFYEMLTVKTWTLPDRFVYNLMRPLTWDDFSKRIPIEELDFLKVIDIWSSVCEYMAHHVKPKVDNIR